PTRSVAASGFWMVSNRLWSGSTRTIFFPVRTHLFAQSGFVPVYNPPEARPPAQPSSESQPRNSVFSVFCWARVCDKQAEHMEAGKERKRRKPAYEPPYRRLRSASA